MSEYKNRDKQIEIRGLETTTVTADLEPVPAGYISGIVGGKEITGKDGAAMVLIPAGEFTMGSESGKADEKPLHKVYLDAYYIDKYEVTNEQYAKFLNAYGKDTDESGKKMIYENSWEVEKKGNRWQLASGYDKNPVVYVTWYGANQYAKYYGKRLPTEAEWEKACRAGTRTAFHYGDSLSSKQANFDGNYPYGGAAKGVYRPKTLPVGSFQPNAWGLYDMHGNVWEWCSDWYDKDYYKNSPYENPKGPGRGSDRVLRGGSWGCDANGCRSTNRNGNAPDNWDYYYGFRCVVGGSTQ